MAEDAVQLVNPIAGTVETVPGSDAKRLKRQGWSEASAEQVRGAELEQKHGGVGGQLTAAGAGALRAATFGVSDVALSEVGGEETRETLAELREVNPYASGAGEIAGSLIGLGKFGGAGVVSRGMRALSAPQRALVRGGEALERGLGGKLLGGVARGGLEGAAFGVQETLTESALENKALTGEALLSNIGYGAAVGGGLGGALYGGGRLLRAGQERLSAALRSPTAEGAEALARQAFGEAADGVGDAMSRTWARGAGALGVGGAETVEKLGALTPASKQLRQKAVRSAEILEREGERAVQGITELHQTLREAGDEFTGQLKRGQVDRVIARENAENAILRSQGEVGAVRAQMEEMIASGRGAFGKQGTIKKLRDQATALEKRLSKMDNATDAMMAVDDFKRDVGKMTVQQSGKKAHSLQGPERATRQRFDDLYERMRGTLEDESVWGGAAKLQRELNEPWARTFEQQREGNIFKELLTTREGRFGERSVVLDEKKLRTLLKNPSDPIAQKTIEGMRTWLETGEQFVKRARENLTVKNPGALAKYEGTLGTVREALGEMTEAHSLGQQLDALSAGAAGGQTAAAGMGYMLGALGPAGAPLSMLAGAVADPARGIRQLAAIETMAAKSLGRISKAPAKLARAAKAVPRLGAATALSERTRARHERAADQVSRADLAQVEQDTRMRLSGMAQGAPETIDLATQATIRATAYLQEHAPRPRSRPDVLEPAPPPSDHELETFARRSQVVNDPLVVLEQVQSGDVTREGVHALENVYPEMAEQIRQSYRGQLIDMAERGESLPYQTTLSVELLLGQPLEGLHHPDAIAVVQQSYQQRAEQAPARQPREKPELAEHFKDNLFDESE